MYCPNCGKENNGEQRFCRACGLGLQTISEALAGELLAPKSSDPSKEIVKADKKRWRNPLLYAFILLILGLSIIVVGKKLFGEQLVADMGTAIAVLGMALLGYTGVSLLGQATPSTRPAVLPEAKTTTLPEAKPTTELPTALPEGQPASVTEHTTRQFEPIYVERKKE